MTPRAAKRDFVHGCWMYFEQGSNVLALHAACSQTSNFSHFVCGQFRHSMAFPTGQFFRDLVCPVVVSARQFFRVFAHPMFFARWTSLPAFLVPVSIVFCTASKPEARWVAARWLIALVQHKQSERDVPKMDLPTQPVSQVSLIPKTQHPISLDEVGSLPFPTLVGSSFVDLCPKTGFVFLCQLWQRLFSRIHIRTMGSVRDVSAALYGRYVPHFLHSSPVKGNLNLP